MSGLLQARALPDGSFEYGENRDAIDRLRNGDATLGWSGDEHLSLVINLTTQRWEVWYACTDGVDRMVMHKPMRAGEGIPIVGLIRAIVAADTRHIDVVGEVEAANVKREVAKAAAFREQTGEAGEKLAHALAKDLDIPAPDGKLYPLT